MNKKTQEEMEQAQNIEIMRLCFIRNYRDIIKNLIP